MNQRSALRVLVLAPFAPRLDAPHGGGRVLAQMLMALSQRHRVALVCLRGDGEPPVDDALLNQCDIVMEERRPSSGMSTRQRIDRSAQLGLSLARSHPMWVADWHSRAFAARMRDVAVNWRPDVVQVEFHVMGQYLPWLSDCPAPRVLTEYDPGIGAAPYLKRLSPVLNRWVYRLDQRAWRRYETWLLRRVHAVVTFSQRDRQLLEPIAGSTPLVVIAPGTNIPARPLNPAGVAPQSVLFMGNFIHAPNIDAALRLVSDILPRVRAALPDTVAYVVGDQPPPELLHMAGDGLVITGRVPDVETYLDRAAVFVAPIRTGGGIRVKVMEALAAGKAVVASSLAVSGLAVCDGEHVVVADDNESMAQSMIRLLADPSSRVALASRARAWACANLGWARSIEAYEKLYQSLLRAHGRPEVRSA